MIWEEIKITPYYINRMSTKNISLSLLNRQMSFMLQKPKKLQESSAAAAEMLGMRLVSRKKTEVVPLIKRVISQRKFQLPPRCSQQQ